MAGCELLLDLPDEGSNHFTNEDDGTYKTNPPTSGDHFAAPDEAGTGATADGAYLTKPPESRLVHAMEHGRVEIRYDPNLPEDQQLALKGVFDEDPDGMIFVPDPEPGQGRLRGRGQRLDQRRRLPELRPAGPRRDPELPRHLPGQRARERPDHALARRSAPLLHAPRHRLGAAATAAGRDLDQRHRPPPGSQCGAQPLRLLLREAHA